MENTRIYWRLIWRRLEDLFDKVDHQNVQKMIKIFNRDFSENQTIIVSIFEYNLKDLCKIDIYNNLIEE